MASRVARDVTLRTAQIARLPDIASVPTSVDRLNHINIALMVIACVAAIVAPFHLFLAAYAILGPLHYLTEISWLHDRKYFTPRPAARRVWLTLVAITTLVMIVGYVATELLGRAVPPVYEIGLFLFVFATAAIALYVRHAINVVALLVISATAIALFATKPAYGIVAYLLMTLIHVFVFTGAFILFGATKSRSRSGFISFAVFLACAIATLVVPAPFHAPQGSARTAYSAFEQLNAVVLQLMGQASSDVYAASAIGVMRFIAFAYTYHYFNWFSKTSVIGWHHIPRRRAIGIVAAWIGGVTLYAFSYQWGFAVFYVLSVVHVMLEFPLNFESFKGLGSALVNSVAPRIARDDVPVRHARRSRSASANAS